MSPRCCSRLPPRACWLLVSVGLALATAAAAFGQTVSPAPVAPRTRAEAPIVLSAFTVDGSEENGYAASTALAGTGTNEKLAHQPNSISVITAEFMSDLALNDIFGAVEFAIGAENIYNDTGTVGAPVGARSGNQIGFRGIPSVRQLRDGFPWFLPQDAYNTERIEFARGPGGVAYGDVDPAGLINVVTKRATFRRRGSATVRYDSFGTQRYSFDLNQPLHPRLAVRFNALNSEVEQFRQRANRDWRGYAGAVRWEPWAHGRTRLDLTYEGGHTRNNQSTLHLNDGIQAYVRGTGTNAPDADPLAPGVQVNGVGMRRIAAPGNATTWLSLGGVLHNMQSTATTTFRSSVVLTGATVASGADPQNPRRYPLVTIPYDIIPDGEDWAGPDNRHDTDFHAYNVELTHSLGPRLRLLLGHNGQRDATTRLQTYSGAAALGMNARAVFIDVNRVLPHPTERGATVPNPRFEELFLAYAPTFTTDGNRATGWRTSAAYDDRLPWRDSAFRAVFGASYRHEQNYLDTYAYSLTRDEMARRGITGAAATYPNNVVHPVHYLADGNSDEALRLNVVPGETAFYRSGTAGQTRFDQTLGSASLATLGRFFGGALHTSAGLSRDYFRQNRNRPATTFAATGEAQLVDLQGRAIAEATGYNVPYEPLKRAYSTNQTYGGVWRVRPWLSLAGGYFESSMFTDSTGVDLYGRPRLPRTGEGRELSARFALLDGRINATVTHFVTRAENYTLALSAAVQAELNALLPPDRRILGPNDYVDAVTRGAEFEVQTNVTRQWTLRATYSLNRARYDRAFFLVQPFLAVARETARAGGRDPDDATRLTQQLIENAEETSGASTRRVTANLATRYTFSAGRLEGLAVGASARFVMGRARNALSSGGVVVLPATRTDDYVLVNPFASYRRTLFGLNVSVQLNVNNVFGVHSDQGNSYTWPRFTEPRRYITSATVAF